MKRLSESGEVLIQKCAEATHAIDTLIVGSGYGGSVAALRFSAHGLPVYVLERGDEYVSGEFPNDVSQIGKHARAEILTADGVTSQGYENALFDIRLGAGIGAIVGNGLGGGSLINAAIGLQADPRVFKQTSWPAGIRDEGLSTYYDLASSVLELQTPDSHGDGQALKFDPAQTKKYQRLNDIFHHARQQHKQADSEIEVSFEPLPMAIQLEDQPPQHLGKRGVCNGCGDCVTGCNYHAKLSMTATYLPRAVQKGAQIFTGLTVLTVQKNPDYTPDAPAESMRAFPWVVTFVRTAERALARKMKTSDIRTNADAEVRDSKHWEYKIFAKRVVLSAGTFGSTEILLRSRQAGLAVSKSALGMGFSGNGDDISFAFGAKDEVNGIGNAAYQNPQAVTPSDAVGPTASGVIFFKHKKDVTQSTLMEDGAIPSLMRRLLGEFTHTLGTVIQLSNFSMRQTAGKDPLAVDPDNSKHTMGLLGMGHDSGTGILILDAMSDRLALAWPDAKNEKSPVFHKLRQSIVKKVGALFIQNPATAILPESITGTLSGASQETALVTVHPLGGCRMADNVYTGVVNHWGAVFVDDGKSTDQTFDGLYVLDGAIIPSALGVNPMLTITALAERACEKILLNIPKGHAPSVDLKQPDSFPQPLQLSNQREHTQTETRLSEVLRCEAPTLSASFRHSLGLASNQTVPAALFVEMDVVDWDSLLLSESHEVRVIPTQQGGQRFTRTRLVLDVQPWPAEGSSSVPGRSLELAVSGGTVRLFERKSQCIFSQIEVALRIFLTYGLGRWLPDALKAGAPKKPFSVLNAAKLIWHASEVRTFDYDLQLEYQDKKINLRGKKIINAAAEWGQLWQVLKHLPQRKIPRLQRKSVWEQLTQLQVELTEVETGEQLLSANLAMDFPAMMRRFTPQLGYREDTLNGLIKLAGYPLFLLRGIIKTHLLDFRLPDYKDDVDEDALLFNDAGKIAKPPGYRQVDHIPEAYRYPPLTLADGRQTEAPTLYSLDVKFDDRSATEDTELALIRYSQPHAVQQNNCTFAATEGVFKAKSIVLINGFALTTHAFVATELKDKNLAAMLYAQGWDVWLFEYRGSPLLDVSTKYFSIDDIAKYDLPAAFAKVTATVAAELGQGNQAIHKDNLQVYCFSHCVGSAALMMSLLSGRLRHECGKSKLAGILISQFQPLPVGSKTTQVKLQLSSFIRNVLNLDLLQFSAGHVKASGFYQVLDRVLASFNYHVGNHFDNELCPHERDNLITHQPDSTSCKRMTGIFGRSMVHDNLLTETHDKLDLYFGRANVGVFLQGAKCVEYEQLVNADGQNIYVNDSNLIQYLDMPVMVLHGKENVLFNEESYHSTKKTFERVFGQARLEKGLDKFLLAEKYAHFDCTIGKQAYKDIFAPAIDFFNHAHASTQLAQPSAYQYAYHPRLPLTGPIVGWVRHEGDEVKCRVWFEIENDRQGLLDRTVGLTKVSYGNTVRYQLWKVYQQTLRSQQDVTHTENKHAVFKVYFCVADIVIPKHPLNGLALDVKALDIQCLSLHKIIVSDQPVQAVPDFQHTLDAIPDLIDTTPFVRHALEQLEPLINISDARDIQQLSESYVMSSNILDTRKQRANAADPQTLIRRVLDLQDFKRSKVELSAAVLQESEGHLQFVAAGCRHLGLTGFEAERADYSLKSVAQAARRDHAKFMLMLGDQVYLDARAGVLDKSTLIERLVPRYRQAFNTPGFQDVAKIMPIYMTMDDHEIKDNWSTEHQQMSEMEYVLAKNAKSAFFVYQRCFGPPQTASGTDFDYAFNHHGFHFFALDTRSHKTRVPEIKILTEQQWLALERWLKAQDQNKPKFIVTGSVVVPGLVENAGDPAPRQSDNWQMSPIERARLFDLIQRYQMNNVVFLSCDYHSAACSKLKIGADLNALAIVTPPLHAPMRFANSRADEIMRHECFTIASGLVTVETEAWDGEGWLAIGVDLASKTIQLDFHLKDFPDAAFKKIPRSYLF